MSVKFLISPFTRETPTKSSPTWLLPVVSAIRNCHNFQGEAISNMENNLEDIVLQSWKGMTHPV